MIIDLENVGVHPKSIELKFQSDEIDFEIEGVSLKEPVSFNGEAVLIDKKVHIRGSLSTELQIDCTRCLEPIDRLADIEFESIYIDPSDEAGETEKFIDPVELDESIAENGRISVSELAREQLLLSLPEQIICKDECKGLCPICGTNRNLLDCRCNESEIDPRWSALKVLR